METRKEVKQVQVDYRCPKCKKGYLRPTGMALPCNPPEFPHKCNNSTCDYMDRFLKQYPYIDYEEITNQKLNVGIDRPNIITAADDYSSTTGNASSYMYYNINSIIPSNNGNNF